jgi:hypothetical protein
MSSWQAHRLQDCGPFYCWYCEMEAKMLTPLPLNLRLMNEERERWAKAKRLSRLQ